MAQALARHILSPCWRQVSFLSIRIVAFFFLPLSTPVGNSSLSVAAACDQEISLARSCCRTGAGCVARTRSPPRRFVTFTYSMQLSHLPSRHTCGLFAPAGSARPHAPRSRDDLPMRKPAYSLPLPRADEGEGISLLRHLQNTPSGAFCKCLNRMWIFSNRRRRLAGIGGPDRGFRGYPFGSRGMRRCAVRRGTMC